MHEELPCTERVFVEDITFFIRADVHVVDIYFAVLNANERLLHATLTHTDGLHFRTDERNAGFVFFFDKILVICLFIVRYQLYIIF